VIIVANDRFTPNHPSIRKPNNPNEQAAFQTGDKSFHTGDTDQ
jgi:hypothetical protein